MPSVFSSSSSALTRCIFSAAVALVGAVGLLQAQIPSRNVNMVSGGAWPGGDPYLQRQNEPSLAASTRNPLHLLAGSNDYRTVDLPGLPGGGETGDAWLGLYRSFDGGQRWQSTLLPGYPQDTSAAGKAAATYGYQAAADPVVRPGTSGLFYYSGIVFDRTAGGKSRVFVARFIDNNDKEAGDPIHYLGSSAVASTSGAEGDFIDKPWMAVDIPRVGAQTCSISTPAANGGNMTQRIPGGAVYVAYAVITTTRDEAGTPTSVTGRIMFTRSLDCGVTWSTPIQVSSPDDPVNQGVAIAIDPATGAIQLAWRRFGHGTTPDAIVTTRAMPGAQFENARVLRQTLAGRELGQLIRTLVGNRQKNTTPEPESPSVADGSIVPFDQGTSPTSFRTNSYPTMAIDGTGRVYIAWSERNQRNTGGGANTFDSSIVMTTGQNGANWNTPFGIDLHTGPGHQLMPSLAFAGGKLMLAYYDLREDISGLFQEYIDEAGVRLLQTPRRHTVDLRAAQAPPGEQPVFGGTGARSIRVSEYLVGSRPNSRVIEQLQFNPPNLPLFELGHVPFMGDYVDIAAAPAFVQDAAGAWAFNTASAVEPVFHAAWTDNRDVKPPPDGDWSNYTPPSGSQINSVFDPTKFVEPCSPGRAGMRNQNVYTSRLTTGLMVGSPGNSKPLSPTLPRAFVVFAQNTTSTLKWFRMTITAQPVDGWASFSQVDGAPVLSVNVTVPARSTVSKSVFATSSDPDAKVQVSVQEIETFDATVPLAGGLTGTVILNPDISNPDISNPDISNPDISNPDISNVEVYNPDISNPDISNPDISNPDISNPDISNPDISNVLILNPDISNPDISNPDISNPDISNPDISNPDISNPDISNGSLTDYTWKVTNTGNTTSNYDVDLFGQTVVPAGVKTQVIIHKTYTTPVSDGCTLKQQLHTVLVTNVVNPQLLPDGSVDLTLWLEPGGEGRITLRVIDPDPTDDVTFNPVSAETPVSPTVTSTAVNTEDLDEPTPEPPSATPPSSTETSTSLSVVSQPVNSTVDASLGTIEVRVMRTVDGSTSPFASASVAAGLLVNPSGAHLNGQTTVATDSNGYATFNTLSVDRAGSGYQLLFTAATAGAVPAPSALFSVTPGSEVDPDQNIFIVTSTSDAGPGSLRQAILNANSTPNGTGGPDVITFGVRPEGIYTITLATPLPALTDPVIIDGSTQSGYNPSTGQPRIHVSGPGTDSFQGIVIAAPNSIVRALSLTGFGTTSSPNTTAAIHTFAANVVIEGNWIGVTPTGTATGNKTGIWITGGNPTIGGTGGAATRNIISAGGAGIYAAGGANAIIRGNYIGTSPDGLAAVPNGLGINVQPGVNGFIIGGPLATGGYFAADSPANLISGNLGGGIELQASAVGPANTQILGNIIGLSADGSDLGNNNFGIRAQSASGTQIGAAGAGNVISGNGEFMPSAQGRGIIIATNGQPPPAVMPIIRGNRIGVSIDGTEERENMPEGILLETPAIVGGTGQGEGNQIAGNGHPDAGGAGILAQSGAGGSIIQGNVVGLSSTGARLGNNEGIVFDGTLGGVTIGGAVAGAGNVVSGNTYTGITIKATGADVPENIIIKGNFIGTTPAGAVAGVGNGGFGISISAGEGHVIGGDTADDGNVIAGNGNPNIAGGIEITGAGTRRVDVRSNSIFSNNGVGIDHGAQFGVSPNTPGGGTGGANDRQNFPLIEAAANTHIPMGYVRLRLDSATGTYKIQVFSNTSCDESGHGEGQTLLLSTDLVIPPNPANPTELIVEAADVSAGQILTATATDDEGNTSEFSACATVTATSAFYWSPQNGGNGHFYEYVTTPGTWDAADTAANAASLLGRTGHLAVITSANENTFVNQLYTSMTLPDMRAWIGLADFAGTGAWEWVTGETFGFSNWWVATGEPNNIGLERYVEIFANGFWNNITGSGGPNQGYVIEYQFPLSF